MLDFTREEHMLQADDSTSRKMVILIVSILLVFFLQLGSNQKVIRYLLMEKMEPQPSYTSPPYPYPQPPPPMPSQQNTVIVSGAAFSKESQHLTCPHCHANIATRVDSEANMKTHLFALLLCVFGCWCCVPCPYCMDSCTVHKHYCPSCGSYLGESQN